jgi:hypothetical protein
MGLVMSPQAWPVNTGDEAVASAGEDENPVRGVESDVLEEAREVVMGRSVEGVRSAVRVKRRVSTPLADLLRAKFLYLVKYSRSSAGLEVLLIAVVLCSRIGMPGRRC